MEAAAEASCIRQVLDTRQGVEMTAERRRLSMMATVVGVAAVMLSMFVSTAHADPDKDGAVTEVLRTAGQKQVQSFGLVANSYTRRCLSVQAANNVNGAPVFQFDCVPNGDQYWNVTPSHSSTYPNTFWFSNNVTNRCLSVQGANNVNGAPAFQYDCVYNDQLWYIFDAFNSNGAYLYSYVKNVYTGRCLSVQGANNVNGAPAFQYDCNALADQRWLVP
jgi:hypothetical protein